METHWEDRSWRNNLRKKGIDERPNETCEDCEATVQDMLKKKLTITDDAEFKRCHRMPKKSNQNHPWTIICKATKFKNKQKILKNAKHLEDIDTYIYEDFCQDTMNYKCWNQKT